VSSKIITMTKLHRNKYSLFGNFLLHCWVISLCVWKCTGNSELTKRYKQLDETKKAREQKKKSAEQSACYDVMYSMDGV
jgi:hypothetical protein